MDTPQSSHADVTTANIERVKAFFEPRPALHGDSYLAVDWGSQQSQCARFQTLGRLIPLQHRSLLDVGCGMGHLLDWLHGQEIQLRCYEGVDVTGSMVQAARLRHPVETFLECDLLSGGQPSQDGYDVVFASGIFYLALSEPYQFLASMLGRLFELTQQALVFNILTASGTDVSSGGEFRADIDHLLTIVSELSPFYCLDHSYHRADVTVAVFREPR
jgi:SAM-dependent methyltransferase